jgi:putative heme-binding domain-containing protein
VISKLSELDLLFGDGRALGDLRKVIADSSASASSRRNALRALVENRSADLAPLLRDLSNDNTLRADAIVGLLQIDDPQAASIVTGRYQWIVADERGRVLGAMVSRAGTARALLDAVAAGTIPKADLTPFHARQIAGLGDASVGKRLEEVWGTVRAGNTDKQAVIRRMRGQMNATFLQAADLTNGRQLFNQLCAACHKLYGEGGLVGPDLTGSGRASLDYLLENVVDPSAVVPADYRMAVVTLKDGRVLNGVLRDKTERTVTVQSQTERLTVERREIESLEESTSSIMPEGLLESLNADAQRDLLGYLMHPKQAPLTK